MLVMMIIIFVHSAMPADVSEQESSFLADLAAKLFRLDPETASFFVRKCAHFTEYLILGVCMLFAVNGRSLPDVSGIRIRFLRRGLPAWVFGTIYAVTDEIHQHFVPGRSCELRDVCIDAAGVMAGVWIGLLIGKLRKKG